MQTSRGKLARTRLRRRRGIAVLMALVMVWTQVSAVPTSLARAGAAPPVASAQEAQGAAEGGEAEELAGAGEEPAVVEEPTGEEPAGEESAAVEELAAVEVPALADEPAVIEEPAVADDPAGADATEPAGSTEGPATVEEPAAAAAEPAAAVAEPAGEGAEESASEESTPDEALATPETPAESAAPEPADLAFPAFAGEAAAGGVTVRVTAPAGVLPAGTSVRAELVGRTDVVAAVADAVEERGRVLEDAVAVDVTLVDADGNVIQPSDSVSVSFAGTGISAVADQVGVWHVADDAATVEEVPTTLATPAVQSIEVGHFSIYVITDERVANLATYRFLAADGVLVSAQVVKDGEVLVEPQAPEITGRAFSGWYLAGAPVAFGEPVSVRETATYDVTATYAEARHINFYSADGTRLMRSLVVADTEAHDISGVRYDVDATHRVVGWTDARGVTVTSVAVPEDADHVDVFAIVVAGVWVAFDSAGGTAADHAFVQVGEGVVLPTSTRAGYVLDGWYLGDSKVADGDVFQEPVTLVARWTPAEATYTVNYWQQRASDDKGATDADKTYDFAESVQSRGTSGSVAVVDKGRAYPGFTYNAAKSQADVAIAGDGSTIVNVYYDRVVCTVRFWEVGQWGNTQLHEYQGLYGAPLADGEWADDYFWYTSYKNGNTDGTGCVLLTSYDFAAAGYGSNKGNVVRDDGVVTTCNFYGNSSARGGVIYYYNEQADGSFKLANTVRASGGTLTVYEKYEGYELYKWAFGRTFGDPTVAPFWARQADVREGDATDADVVLIANRLESYDLVFHNVNAEAKVESVKYTTPLASYAGYIPDDPYADGLTRTFGGWYADAACTIPFDFAATAMPHANVKVYAKWTVDQVTLTYDLNAPEGARPEDRGSATFDPGTVAAVDVLPAGAVWDEHYTFDGWYTEDSKLFDVSTRITRDTTVTGRWLYNGTFGVRYVNGASELALDGRAYADGAQVQVASGEGLAAPDGNAPHFLGWTLPDGTLVVPGGSFEMTPELAGGADAVTLTAAWGPAETATTITYRAGAGEGADVSGRLVNNEGVVLPDASELGFSAPDGHVFSGWADASGRAFAAGQCVVVDDVNAGEENVLTAQWAPRADLSYTVRYVWVGSDVEVAPAKTVTGVTYGADLREEPVEAQGYTPVRDEAIPFRVTDDGMCVDVYYYKNVELTAASDTRTYTGAEQWVWGYEASVDGVQVPGVQASGHGTDAGTYPVTFEADAVGRVDASERYIVSAAHDGVLTIEAVPVQSLAELVTADEQKEYDGTPLAAAPAQVRVAALPAPVAQADDEAEATPDVGADADARAEAILAQLALEYSADGASWTSDPDDICALNAADSMTAAGGNAVQVRVRPLTDNIAGELAGTEDVLVTPRHLTLTAGSASKAYDGTPLTTSAHALTSGSFAAADPSAPEGFADVTIDGSQTYVGSSEATVGSYTFAEGTCPDNYLVATVAGLLTVTDGSDADPVDPGKVVTKTHDARTYAPGEAVEFAIAATNIYDTPQTMTFTEVDGVEITGTATFADVEPGGVVTTTARYAVRAADAAAGGFTNTVTVTFASGRSFKATDDVDVREPAPAPTPAPAEPATPAAPEPAVPAAPEPAAPADALAPVQPTAAASAPKTGDDTPAGAPLALTAVGVGAVSLGIVALAAALRRRES